MTWGQQLQILYHFQKALVQTLFRLQVEEPVNEEKLRAIFGEAEGDTRNDVDAAVRAFARMGQLPNLSGEESYFLGQHIEFAVLVTLALCSPDDRDKQIVPDGAKPSRGDSRRSSQA